MEEDSKSESSNASNVSDTHHEENSNYHTEASQERASGETELNRFPEKISEEMKDSGFNTPSMSNTDKSVPSEVADLFSKLNTLSSTKGEKKTSKKVSAKYPELSKYDELDLEPIPLPTFIVSTIEVDSEDENNPDAAPNDENLDEDTNSDDGNYSDHDPHSSDPEPPHARDYDSGNEADAFEDEEARLDAWYALVRRHLDRQQPGDLSHVDPMLDPAMHEQAAAAAAAEPEARFVPDHSDPEPLPEYREQNFAIERRMRRTTSMEAYVSGLSFFPGARPRDPETKRMRKRLDALRKSPTSRPPRRRRRYPAGDVQFYRELETRSLERPVKNPIVDKRPAKPTRKRRCSYGGSKTKKVNKRDPLRKQVLALRFQDSEEEQEVLGYRVRGSARRNRNFLPWSYVFNDRSTTRYRSIYSSMTESEVEIGPLADRPLTGFIRALRNYFLDQRAPSYNFVRYRNIIANLLTMSNPDDYHWSDYVRRVMSGIRGDRRLASIFYDVIRTEYTDDRNGQEIADRLIESAHVYWEPPVEPVQGEESTSSSSSEEDEEVEEDDYYVDDFNDHEHDDDDDDAPAGARSLPPAKGGGSPRMLPMSTFV